MLSNITLLYFFSLSIICFSQKEPIIVQIYEAFECSGKNCQIPYVSFEIPSQFLLEILYHSLVVMAHNSSVNFKLIHFLLWIKGHFESPNFQVLWWKFTVFLSFSKPQVKVFLQILHHSSVSWKRPPLYFFTSYTLHKHITYFECSSQNSPNFCHFASLFSATRHNSSIFF